MNAIAGFFPKSEAADSAVADLRLQGFTRVRLESCPERDDRPAHPSEAPQEGEVAAPVGAQPGSEIADGGGIPLGGWADDASGWALLNLFQINEGQQTDAGEQGPTFVVVDVDPEQVAVARVILERNGAERVRAM